MRKQGYSSIFIVDRKNKLLGALTAEQARQAIDQNQSIFEVMTTDIPTVSEDTLLADLMDVMATSSLPISVIDEETPNKRNCDSWSRYWCFSRKSRFLERIGE